MDEDVQSLLQKHHHRRAFERLLDNYEAKVFRMAVMFLRDRGRAEEVTQDIFLKLWQVLPAYDGRAAPSTWLYTIARNTCLSALRSEAHRKTLPLDSIAEPIAAEATGSRGTLNRIESNWSDASNGCQKCNETWSRYSTCRTKALSKSRGCWIFPKAPSRAICIARVWLLRQ